MKQMLILMSLSLTWKSFSSKKRLDLTHLKIYILAIKQMPNLINFIPRPIRISLRARDIRRRKGSRVSLMMSSASNTESSTRRIKLREERSGKPGERRSIQLPERRERSSELFTKRGERSAGTPKRSTELLTKSAGAISKTWSNISRTSTTQ
jgi:hypothetical protein